MAHCCPIESETVLELDLDLMFIHAGGPLVCKIEAKLGRPILGLTTHDVYEMFGSVEGHSKNPVPSCLDGKVVTWHREVGNQTINCWAHPKYDGNALVGVLMHVTTAPVKVTA